MLRLGGVARSALGVFVSALWIDVLIAALLVASGLLSLIGAIGLLRLRNFFQRMHPTALANTLGAWCLALAAVIHFSMLEWRVALQPWLLVVLLAITTPVTTSLLARAALFRSRQGREPVPPPLHQTEDSEDGR